MTLPPALSSKRLRRQLLAAASALALGAGVFMVSTGAHAEPTGPDWTLDQSDLTLDGSEISLAEAGITDLTQEIDLFIQLDEPAVTEFVANEVRQGRGEPAAQARRAQAERVSQQHDGIRGELARLGIEERSSMRVAANGLRVWAAPQDIPTLAGLPGVVSVAPVTLHEPANDTSVPWINTPEAWDFLGATGEDIIISVIDTGIDYTHASFGGSGDPADYDFIAQDTTVIPEVDGAPVFPTAKVIDGFDFVGVNYNAGDPENDIPEPNPNPIDVHGHGTHVAGSAAGVDVTDGSGDVVVGSGVAPGALLYAAKVFGDIAGSTAVTADAIEWSLDPTGDGSMTGQADVINMSLGASFGHPDDPSAIASHNATEVGTVVVASAGNSGHDAAYVTGSPAVAPGAISVAASVDGGIEVLGLEVNSPDEIADTYEAAESAISVPLSQTGPIIEDVAVADPLIACEENEDGDLVPRIDNPEELAGKIALVQRGLCPFTMKHLAVQDAGAVAILVFNNVPGDPIVMGGSSAGIEIPGVMISLADGNLIHGTIGDGETVNVTMSADIVIPKPELADTLAGFTSRGPGHTSLFKPDVAAPGFAISSASVGAGTGASTSSGTSMAAPHVAGLAALLVQQHGMHELTDPDERAAKVSKIKSLIMNSTVPAAEDGNYPLALQGTGVVRADRAVMTDAFTSPGGLSFGRLHVSGATSVTEAVSVTNLADSERTFDIDFAAWQEVPGVTVTHDSSVTVAGGGTASFNVTLSLDPAAMPDGLATFTQTEVDGWLVLDDGVTSMHTGLLAVVDPAAAVQVSTVPPASGPPWQVNLSNPSETTGVAHGFTLVGTGDEIGGVTEAIGVRTTDAPGLDVVQFGIATDAWETLSTRETQILLDVDRDGVPDFLLVAADLGTLTGAAPTGTVVTALFDLSTGAGTLQFFATADYHDSVQILTIVRHVETGFGFLPADADQEFDYTALTFERGALIGVQEGSVSLTANVDGRTNPSLGLPAGGSTTLEFPASDARQMLWLHHNNEEGTQFNTHRLPPVE